MELLRNLTLKVELFAGTDVRDAACDLCTMANRVGILVEAKFNDVKLWARPGDNPLELVDAYYKQLNSASTYKIAQARDV